MESSYGVGVANRFAIPDEEDVEVDDPLDILQSAEKKATEQKKEVKKPIAKGKAPEKAQPKTQANDKPKGQNRGSDKPRGERGDRKPREGGERRPRREGNNRGNNGEGGFGGDSSWGGNGETQSFGQAGQSTFGGERDTRERGRGRGRGRGGPRPPREGRREFDRRSGSDKSGVRAHEKRDGAGPRNWGATTDFAPNEEGAPAENGEETTPTVPAEGAEGDAEPKAEGEEAAPAVEDEDAKLMTLDEYKKLQKESRFKADLNVRKAGENEDGSKWKNTKRYERPAVASEDGVEYVIEKKDQRSHSRQTVDMNFRFDAEGSARGAPPTRRGGRGGRGGSRGGGPGGRGFDSGRGGDKSSRSYNFRDDDFPALG